MNKQNASLGVRAVLSVIAIGGYGYVVAVFLASDNEITEPRERILIFLFGALTTTIVSIVNYWFSSSQGSVEKQATIEGRP